MSGLIVWLDLPPLPSENFPGVEIMRVRSNATCATVFIQKALTHYRRPLFVMLHERLGWTLAAPLRGRLDRTFEVPAPLIGQKDLVVWRVFRRPLIMAVRIGVLLRKQKPAIVIAEFSMYFTSTYSLALRRCVGGRPRLIFHTHGFNMERDHDGWSDRLMDWVRLRILNVADAIACYSADGKAYLDRHLDPRKVFVTRNTIDIAPMRCLRRTSNPLRFGEGPHLLAVGRMTPDKRFPALVEIFRRFRDRFPDAHLILIGEGPDQAAVRAAAGDLLDRFVHLPGRVYQEERLAPYFLGADAFVFAGAVGLSVNHALAYGLPVVTFRRTPRGPRHHPEIAYVIEGETGWLVDEFEDAALAGRLQEIFTAMPFPKERLAARIDRYVDENLTLDHLVEDFHRVHQYVTNAAGSRSRGRWTLGLRRSADRGNHI